MWAVMPELILLVMSCVVMFAHLFWPKAQEAQATYMLSQVSLIAAAGVALKTWGINGLFWGGHILASPLTTMLKLGIFVTVIFVFAYAKSYFNSDSRRASEYYLLGLFSVMGMCVLVSSGTMLSIYLGLELLSLPLYAMIAIVPSREFGSEAAMKYFVMGALASGMLLFGMSLVYGSTGSLDLVAMAVDPTGTSQTLLLIGLVFIVVGIAFKFGAVPFHLWLPDVYQGAAQPVVLFIACAPKIAAFGMLYLLLSSLFGHMSFEWEGFVFVMAVLSLILGNVTALVQKNIKRLLGYSAIAHVGFIFLAVYAGAFASALYYVFAYVLMTAAAFGVLVILSNAGVEIETIDSLKGLNKRNPWIAFLLLLIFFSLAGVPPTIGFYAKLSVLMALVNEGALLVAVLGLLMSVVGAYYYLKIIKVVYFEDAVEGPFTISRPASVLLSINAMATWLLGLTPGLLMGLCLSVM
jgi:NADH-quinone oxidoreductase subunit N